MTISRAIHELGRQGSKMGITAANFGADLQSEELCLLLDRGVIGEAVLACIALLDRSLHVSLFCWSRA